MCPDVEAYAPLVRAAFGAPGAGHPGHRLRVRLADRALTRTNPLLDVVAGLLALADGRVTASDVLDLAAAPPVRRAFALRDDDLERLRDWAARTGVRWGLGAREREAHALGGVPHGTWRTGLDRLLLGVTADESDLGWLGHRAAARRRRQQRRRPGRPAGRAGRPARRGAHGAAGAAARRRLDGRAAARARPADRRAGGRRLDARAGRARARRGLRARQRRPAAAARRARRCCAPGWPAGPPARTSAPATSPSARWCRCARCPHRVVALLGLDDGAFPRAGRVDGDDVLQRDPCPGERDARAEDRQLLLDAVMSAGDALLLLHTGADPVTGAERPPAVPLGELLDLVAELLPRGGGGRAAPPAAALRPARLLRAGPLRARPRRAGGSARVGARATARAAAARGPAAARLRRRRPGRPRRLLRLAGAGVPRAAARRAACRRPRRSWPTRCRSRSTGCRSGTSATACSPPGWPASTRRPGGRPSCGAAPCRRCASARSCATTSRRPSRRSPTRRCRCTSASRARVDVDVDLGGGRRLTGTVDRAARARRRAGPGEHVVQPARPQAPAHRLGAAARADRLRRRRGARGDDRSRARTADPARALTVPPDDPLAVLRELVELRDEGLRAPLPVAPQAARRLRRPPRARRHGRRGDRVGEEGVRGPLRRRHRPPPRLRRRRSARPARRARRGRADAVRRPACRLWLPLLAVEEVGRP